MKTEKTNYLRRLARIGADPKSEERINDAITVSESIFNLNQVTIALSNTTNPRHEVSQAGQRIFLPDRHFELPLFNQMKRKFGEEYQKLIAYHEFGHAVQVARTANGQTVDIKEDHANLHYLFNGSAVPNRINNFMKELFKEGFADCYAGLCLYKETSDLEVFKKISNIRANRYPEIKKASKEIPPAYFIHPNFNIKAAEYLGDVLAKEKEVFSIPFVAPGGHGVSLERYIERAVIAGCVAALLQELRTNDACLNHFRSFARDFKLDEYSVKRILAGAPDLNEVLDYERSQGISSYFLEMRNRLPESYKSILTEPKIGNILTNSTYQRKVDTSLKLMDVVEIPYSAGVEVTRERIVDLRSHSLNSPRLKVRKF